ncbi:MAG: FkbM family methyltransferase [Firmicutes bacterium]|nr:FkbM family methyltransferase [Bacillota bacterium]
MSTVETYMWDRLRADPKKKVLYGTGNACERIMRLMEERGIAVSGIFASDGFVRGKVFHGFPVESYGAIKERFGGDMTVLLCFGTDRPEVLSNIERIEAETGLFAPDIAVIPETDGSGRERVFDPAFAAEHAEEIKAVRSMLSDEQSRLVFDSVISYRLSGELRYLRACETPEREIWRQFVSEAAESGRAPVLMDLGAYTGDTAELFLSVYDEFSEMARSSDRAFYSGMPPQPRVVAVEPEARNCRKLEERLGGDARVTPVCAAAGSRTGVTEFSVGGGRGSLSRKTRPAAVETIDSLAAQYGMPGLIKLDIEGAEADALEGGRLTIERCGPALMVYAYHRLRDMWELPLMISGMRRYDKVLLRRSPCVPNWELVYIFY